MLRGPSLSGGYLELVARRGGHRFGHLGSSGINWRPSSRPAGHAPRAPARDCKRSNGTLVKTTADALGRQIACRHRPSSARAAGCHVARRVSTGWTCSLNLFAWLLAREPASAGTGASARACGDLRTTASRFGAGGTPWTRSGLGRHRPQRRRPAGSQPPVEGGSCRPPAQAHAPAQRATVRAAPSVHL